MQVHRRTAAGNDASRNASNSELPRKLRTLPISFDGRTKLPTHVTNLSSFGDVNALHESLVQARPIELHPTQAARGSIAQEKSGALTNTNGFITGLGPASSGATNWKPQQDSVRSQLPVYDLASQLKFSNHLQRLPPASSCGLIQAAPQRTTIRVTPLL